MVSLLFSLLFSLLLSLLLGLHGAEKSGSDARGTRHAWRGGRVRAYRHAPVGVANE